MQNYSGLSLRRVVCAAGAGLLLLLGSPYGPPNAPQGVRTAVLPAAPVVRAAGTRDGLNAANASNRLVSLAGKLQRTKSSHSSL